MNGGVVFYRYASIGLGAFALLVFIHAIVSQQMAFTQPGPRTPIADLDSIKVGADADGTYRIRYVGLLEETK